MSIQAAQEFRQQVNASAALQAAVSTKVNNGAIDYAGLAQLGSEHGFAFSAEEAEQALSTSSDELSEFEMELVSGGFLPPPTFDKKQSHFGRG